MRRGLRAIWTAKKLSLVILVLSVVIFNNWIFGVVLNPQLFFQDGSVSEFSVNGEAHSLVFRGLDISAGILFVVLALFLRNRVKSRAGKWLVASTMILGVSNAVDAAFPLHCAQTLITSCTDQVNISLSHFILPSHAYSSILIGICYLILPLAGFLYALEERLKVFMLISSAALITALLSFASVISEYVLKHSVNIHTSGYPQEAQMLILGLWFFSLYFAEKLDSTYAYVSRRWAAQSTDK